MAFTPADFTDVCTDGVFTTDGAGGFDVAEFTSVCTDGIYKFVEGPDITTPDFRTYIVSSENRGYIVPSETRTYTVG